jgi:hypothetical protein
MRRATLFVAATIGFGANTVFCAPSVDEIRNDIRTHVKADASTFWTGRNKEKDTAADFAMTRKYITIYDTDPEKIYRQGEPNGIKIWSKAYASLATGTGWVFHMDNKAILPQYDEFWTAEFETLQNSRHIYEVIQVSSEDQSEFHQIHPWDFLHLPKNCRWTDCAQQCNANEEPFAFSMYGNSIKANARCSGEAKNENAKSYCCPEGNAQIQDVTGQTPLGDL